MSKKICIVGSGNWGSVIAKIVGNNVKSNSSFDDVVNMYVYEEQVDGRNLSEIINTEHENVKYLPGHKLPANVVAVTDVVEAAKDADVLVFVVPHQFVARLCGGLKGKLKQGASAISLIKGVDITPKGLELISARITEMLNIPCAVLMGANVAGDVAKEDFCEATIDTGRMLRSVFEAPYFQINVVDDVETVELCGALKNIVATGAGFCDGLGQGSNTKAAVIRIGLAEMVKFCALLYPSSQMATFMESCGVADLITTCYSGRNRKVAEAFVTTKKSLDELENELLNGQKLQGPPTAKEVNVMLKQKGMENQFPLFTTVHRICAGELAAETFLDCLKTRPVV